MKALSDYLAEKTNEPFKWGENDCMLFAAKFVKRITDKDFYSDYGSYNTRQQAQALIKKHAGIEQMVTNALGEPHDNYRKAQRGDIVLMRTPDETLGIVDDSGERVACVSKNGLTRLALKESVLIWRC